MAIGLNNDSNSSGFSQTSTGINLLGDLNADSGTLYVDGTNNRVGIGTTSPLSQLNVFGAGQTTGNISTSSGLGGTLYVRDVLGSAGNGGVVLFGANQGAFAAIKGLLTDNANNTLGNLVFSTRALNTDSTLTERVRIDAVGRIGIGVTNPSATVDILGQLKVRNGSLTTGYALIEYGNSTTNTNNWNVGSEGDGTFRFYTGNFGAGIERMRIDTNGYLLIGYTNSNGAFRLQVNSQIFATSSTVATSDGRYKENIQPLNGALDLVTSLNPVQFDWKKHPIHNFDTETPTVGFIAQEVEETLADKPYLNSIIKRNQCIIEPEEKDEEGNVTKEAITEEFLGIAEGNMIALLTKAIKELKEEVDTLKLQIA